MIAWLADPLTTGAYIWRLERADGIALGFTSHDTDIWKDGFRYRAAPGMIPTSISVSDSLEIDNVEIDGIVSSTAIVGRDLEEGRWNGARLTLSWANWTDPDQPAWQLITGEFGEIRRTGDAFSVEILGSPVFLDAPIVPETSPTCRAHFGDRQCKISRAKFQRIAEVSEIENGNPIFATLGGSANTYGSGELRWLSGVNAGLSTTIIAVADDALLLAEVPMRPILIGDRALLTEGCPKDFASCRDRFNNTQNFRGEPYLPGNDLLTRYPGG
ncbi:MAG: DUF2163 domain-containing protein [Parasphingorhabdus sp.]|nr:DUF2163 domain-containing protein [Parasphingorhabdus sp.]